jgi:hypothetical protein
MDEAIEGYRDAYASDLACHLEIDESCLHPAYTIMTLQTSFKNPLLFPESESENSLDGSVHTVENDNYHLA